MANSLFNSNSRMVQGGDSIRYPKRIGWWERKKLEYSVDDIVYVVSPGHAKRPDLISDAAYGTTQYMWLVLQYNNIVDIDQELIAGKVIRLPSSTRLSSQILTNSTGGVAP